MPERVPQYPERPGRQYEERCRLYCVYMRPWTLVARFQTAHVPLLAKLHVRPGGVTRRLRGKKAWNTYAKSWQWYIHGNVVSQHQARTIVAFMSINSGRSTTDAELDASTAGSMTAFARP